MYSAIYTPGKYEHSEVQNFVIILHVMDVMSYIVMRMCEHKPRAKTCTWRIRRLKQLFCLWHSGERSDRVTFGELPDPFGASISYASTARMFGFYPIPQKCAIYFNFKCRFYMNKIIKKLTKDSRLTLYFANTIFEDFLVHNPPPLHLVLFLTSCTPLRLLLLLRF